MTDELQLPDTRSSRYTDRLVSKSQTWWKRVFDVQAPYRWNLRRQQLGRTLDVGCGIGRNLGNLGPGSVGVDHNADSVLRCRDAGFVAYSTTEWESAAERQPGHFDSMLIAHVIEHLEESEWMGIVSSHLPYVREGGKVMFVCPQERGYASDATHVRFTTDADLVELARSLGLTPTRSFSFPFPRFVGRMFTYNEFNVIAVKEARHSG